MISLDNQFEISSKLVFLNKIPPPNYYKDGAGTLKKFETINITLRKKLEKLFQFISDDANINTIPTFRRFICKHANISVLNFTKNNITFSKNRRFYVFKQCVERFAKKDCCLITYNVIPFSEIICIEQKNDNDKLSSERCFIIKDKNDYIYVELSVLLMYVQNKSLTSQIPFQIADVETFIKSDRCMNNLIQQIAKEASLEDKKPTLVRYLPRKNSPQFTILNYTTQNINFNIYRQVNINDYKFSQFNNDACQIISYSLEGYHEMICLEQQDEGNKIAGPRLFADHFWKYYEDTSKYDQILSQILKELAFQFLWKGIYDENSYFNKEGIPHDIVREITKIYVYFSLNPSLFINLEYDLFERF